MNPQTKKSVNFFLLLLLMLIPLTGVMAKDPASIQAILFYQPFCEACPEVIDEFLVPLSEQHAERLELYPVDISEPPGDEVFHQVLEHFGLGIDPLNSPSVLVGGQLLRGKSEITQGLPLYIAGDKQAEEIKWSDLPGLQKLMDGEAVDASATTGKDTLESGLGWAVMYAMLFSLMYAAWRLVFNDNDLLHVSQIRSWGLPLFALLGLGIGIYLTSVELTQNQLMCGPIGDCLKVQASPFAKLFGIPMAMWGTVFYLSILGLWSLQRQLSGTWSRYSKLALLVFSIFGVLFSVYLTGLELFVIHAVCIWCLSSAVLATLIMLIVTRRVTTPD